MASTLTRATRTFQRRVRGHAAESTIAAGDVLGTVRRSYGLLGCDDAVAIERVHAWEIDLAVADRVAWLAARRDHTTYVVVADGEGYAVCQLNASHNATHLEALAPRPGAPRLMAVATPRGIVPMLGTVA